MSTVVICSEAESVTIAGPRSLSIIANNDDIYFEAEPAGADVWIEADPPEADLMFVAEEDLS